MFDRTVNVIGFDATLGTMHDRQIVTAVVAYDRPDNGQTYMLEIHQAIAIESMTRNLLCPMQMRVSGVQVNEQPKFLTHNPTEETHCIRAEVTDMDEILTIPLSLNGVSSCFPTRKPTLAEYNACENKVPLTAHDPDWEPNSAEWAELEDRYYDSLGNFKDSEERHTYTVVSDPVRSRQLAAATADRLSQTSALFSEVSPTLVHSEFVQSLKQNVQVSSIALVKSDQPKYRITPELLMKRWRCSIDIAKRTIKSTTQRGIRSVANPSIARRFRTNDRQLRYRRLNATVFTDTLKAKTVSFRGNKYAQVYGTRFKWARCHALESRKQAYRSLNLLFARDGVPSNMFMDNAMEQVGGEFRKACTEAGVYVKSTEPHTPKSNHAENTVRELKQNSARKLLAKKAPKRFWDDCMELEAMIMSHTAYNLWELQGQVPETIMTGQTADISQYADIAFYDWVMFRDTAVEYPESPLILGRYLGPSFDVGPAMCAKFLKENGEVVHRTTYRHLTNDEVNDPIHIANRQHFDKCIAARHGTGLTYEDVQNLDMDFPKYEDDDDGRIAPAPDRDDIDDSLYDQYLNAQVLLPHDGKMVTGRVTKRKRTDDGDPIGSYHAKPILDTRVYDVSFPDGSEASYAANVIAENMYAQCDSEGNQYVLLDEIVDHKHNDHAVAKADQYVIVNGRKCKRKTTKGWKLCIRWKDGTSTWERLSDVKESNPVQVAEYSVAANIHQEPAFDWWVPFTLKKRDSIIALVQNRFAKRKFKFGFEIPSSVQDAQRIDAENGDSYWMDALHKEMSNVRVAFQFIEGDNPKAPPGYQTIGAHLIWDIKMEDFRRKARYVAQGNLTEAPKTMTYASVVSRESVRIALTLAALNDLEVKSADIQNAYLTAPCREKICIRVGDEFGEDSGRLAIIVRALYGLISSGAAFRDHLADCMRTLEYKSCLADRDLWYKPMTRPEDGHKYYAYILLYSDDVLCIHHEGEKELLKIDKFFKMKDSSIGDPDMYLGAKIFPMTMMNGVTCWGFSASKYVQEACKNAETQYTKYYGRPFPKRSSESPYPKDYRPETDVSPELDAEAASYYYSAIGVLRWIVELGRVDLITEVSLLSSQLALPREGHLAVVFRLFAFLKHRHNAVMTFDPTYPDIDMSVFKECDWKEFYEDTGEPIPPNAPEPRGKEVDLRLFVDSDHAGDKVNRRSRSGYFLYLNMAPVNWMSKKQAMVESSVFGAEFCAMKVGMEAARGLRYKLRMMGVPISGATFTYGDNMSVIHNTQRPESALKKKANSIAYHACRESVAMGESITGHVPTNLNPADICTKIVPGGKKRDGLVGLILHYVNQAFNKKVSFTL